jgi:hypothetical protein
VEIAAVGLASHSVQGWAKRHDRWASGSGLWLRRAARWAYWAIRRRSPGMIRFLPLTAQRHGPIATLARRGSSDCVCFSCSSAGRSADQIVVRCNRIGEPHGNERSVLGDYRTRQRLLTAGRFRSSLTRSRRSAGAQHWCCRSAFSSSVGVVRRKMRCRSGS